MAVKRPNRPPLEVLKARRLLAVVTDDLFSSALRFRVDTAAPATGFRLPAGGSGGGGASCELVVVLLMVVVLFFSACSRVVVVVVIAGRLALRLTTLEVDFRLL